MGNAIVLGTFDGLHLGHRAVIDAAKGHTRIAVTFRYPPKAFFTGDTELLMLPEDKEKALRGLGVDKTVMLDFGEYKDMSAEDFLFFLKNEYNPKLISCGFNYRFGKGAKGDTELLKQFCAEHGIEFVCCNEVYLEEKTLSSTLLREKIKNGDMLSASSNIYGGFGFCAEVTDGDHRGSKLGFPTINQLYPDTLVKPKFGVYQSTVIVDGKEYKAITNLGIRPTFETEKVTGETHILDYNGNLYGKRIRLRFLRFIRPERKFSSIDELKNAITNDIQLLD